MLCLNDKRVVVFAEGCFGPDASKATAYLRTRHADCVALVDSRHAGRDVGDIVGYGHGIPVVASLDGALRDQPDTLLIDLDQCSRAISDASRTQIALALARGMDVVSDTDCDLSADAELRTLAHRSGGRLWNVEELPSRLRTERSDSAPAQLDAAEPVAALAPSRISGVDLQSAPALDAICAAVPATVMLAEGWAPVSSDDRAVVIATSVVPSRALKERIRTLIPDHRLSFVSAGRVELQDYVIRHHRDEIADHMANGFDRRLPEFSAKNGFATWQMVLGALSLLATLYGLLFAPSGLFFFFAMVGFTTSFLNTILAGAALLPASWFAAGAEKVTKAADLPDGELPFYTVLLPMYKEAAVVGDLIRSMAELQYPRDKLEILLLIEERDVETKQAALASGALTPYMRIIDLPPGPPQTKPRSCNLGMMLAREGLLVIFDAEDRPDADQLLKSASVFAAAKDNDLACVQAKLFFYNDKQNLLTKQFGLEYTLRYNMILPGLARLGLPIPLGGTSNHFRTDMLRAAGGWDAWNVTEDADLGMRCRALGYRVDVMDSITWEEATSTPGAWIRQRTRWLKGFMVTFLVHTKNPLRTLRRFKFTGLFTLVGYIAGAPVTFLGQSLTTPIWVLDLAGVQWSSLDQGWLAWPAMILSVISTGLAIGITLVAALGRQLPISHMATLLPGYWVLYWVAVWRALYQLVRSPFSWEKTPHGHAIITNKGAAAHATQRAAPPSAGSSELSAS